MTEVETLWYQLKIKAKNEFKYKNSCWNHNLIESDYSLKVTNR